MNRFADLTQEQYKSFLGLKKRDTKREKRAAASFRYANVAAPATIDWRDEGHVNPVKDQGQARMLLLLGLPTAGVSP